MDYKKRNIFIKYIFTEHNYMKARRVDKIILMNGLIKTKLLEVFQNESRLFVFKRFSFHL